MRAVASSPAQRLFRRDGRSLSGRAGSELEGFGALEGGAAGEVFWRDRELLGKLLELAEPVLACARAVLFQGADVLRGRGDVALEIEQVRGFLRSHRNGSPGRASQSSPAPRSGQPRAGSGGSGCPRGP